MTSFYVSSSGSGVNGGRSVSDPWSLSFALEGAGGRIQPGDLVWVRGGIYAGPLGASISGTEKEYVVFRAFPGEQVEIDVGATRGRGASILEVTGSFLEFRDLGVKNSAALRIHDLGDSPRVGGISDKGRSNRFVGCSVEGAGYGVEVLWEGEGASNTTVLGLSVVGCGFERVNETRGVGEGLKVRVREGSVRIQDTAIHDSFGANLDLECPGEVTVVNCVFSTQVSGELRAWKAKSGVVRFRAGVKKLVFHRNLVVRDSDLPSEAVVFGGGESLLVESSNLGYGSPALVVGTWKAIYGGGNQVLARDDGFCCYFQNPAEVWELTRNVYFGGRSRGFAFWGGTGTFSEWAQLGLDTLSGSFRDGPTGTTVRVVEWEMVDRFETRRYSIVVVDWDRRNTVTLDLSEMVEDEADYTLTDEVTGNQISAGTYEGEGLVVSLGGKLVSRWILGQVASGDPQELGLLGEAASIGQVNLEWNDVTDVEFGYRVLRKKGEVWEEIANLPANTTQYEDSRLAPNTTYLYKVGYSWGGGESLSSEVSVKTLDPESLAPEAPTQLVVVASEGVVMRGWFKIISGNETGFKVWRAVAGTHTWEEVGVLGGGVSEFTCEGEPNTYYEFRVQAMVGAVLSGYSDVAGTRTFPEAPDAATGLAVSGITSGGMTLTWDNGSEVHTRVVVGVKAELGLWEFLEFPQGTESYVVTSLGSSTVYKWKVQLQNEGGSSPFTGEVTAETLVAVPEAPYSVAAEVVGLEVQLSWKLGVVVVTGVLVERNGGGGWETLVTLAGALEQYVDSSVEDGETYNYRVSAINGSGTSFSVESGRVYVADRSLSTPTEVRAESVSGTRVFLSWLDNSMGETGFVIRRREGSGSYVELVRLDEVGQVAYVDSEVVPETSYTYAVAAWSGEETSDWSAPVEVTTRKASPGNLEGVVMEVVLSPVVGIQLAFPVEDLPLNVEGMRVEKKLGSSPSWEAVDGAVAGQETCVYTNLEPGGSYRFRVQAFNDGGESEWVTVEGRNGESALIVPDYKRLVEILGRRPVVSDKNGRVFGEGSLVWIPVEGASMGVVIRLEDAWNVRVQYSLLGRNETEAQRAAKETRVFRAGDLVLIA